MNISLILTVNNRPPEVSEQVARSFMLHGNQPDEIVIVLDRPTYEARDGAEHYQLLEPEVPVRTIEVSGKPGWKGPARAWNHGFEIAKGDIFYCISSEVVQDPANMERVRMLAHAYQNTVLFGACYNSVPTNLVVGAEPGLLVSTKMPRPLGFLCAIPAKDVKAINGFDEVFMDGFWFDDDDFFMRLWNRGLNFLFDDQLRGTHLDHPRPDLETHEGQEKIEKNRQTYLKKHGRMPDWLNLPRRETGSPGQLLWRHP